MFLYTRVRAGRLRVGLSLGLFVSVTLAVVGFGIWVKPAIATASPANTINFQARLETNSGSIAQDGNYNVRFKLYNASTGGTALWTETYLVSSSQGVSTANGYLTANLGSLTAFPSGISWGQQLYLTMEIGGTGSTPSWDGEMSPRLSLTSVPSAFALNTYNGANGFSSSLSILQPTGGNQIFQIQDQGAAGTYNLCIANSTSCGFATSSGNGNYIQNQIAGAQASSNFWISGTGRAATALQAPSFDSITASSLNIGTTNATSITLGKSGVNTIVAGNLSVGTTSSYGAITLANGAWLTALDSAGTGAVNMLSVNSNNEIQVGAALNIDGGIILPTDGGQMTFSDLPISTSALAGTKESYSLRVGSTNALTVYGEADGSGNAQNVRVAIGSSITPAYTLDVGGDVNTTGAYRINGTAICTSSGCTSAGGSGNYIQNGTTVQTGANFNIDGNGTVGGVLTASGSGNNSFNGNLVVTNTGGTTTITGAGLAVSRAIAYLDNSLVGGSFNLRVSNAATADTVALTVTSTGAASFGSTVNFTGSISGNNKVALQTSDGWLRLNPSGQFASGIYAASGIFRTDGTLQVNAGSTLSVVSGGNFAYGSNILFANTSGNVGIGTASPGVKLDVAHSTGSTLVHLGRISVGAVTSGYGQIGEGFDISGTGYTYRYSDYAAKIDFSSGKVAFSSAPIGTAGAAATFTPTMTILQNGNVGIGTTNPGTYKLNVQGGDVNISNNLLVGGDLTVSGTLAVTGAATFSSTIQATGNITTSGLLVEKSITFTPTAVGWYRVISGGGIVGGVLRAVGAYDNKNTDIELQFNIGGYGTDGSIQQTRYASYNTGVISQARISSTSSGVYLDVYVSSATTPGPITIYGYGPLLSSMVASPVVGAVAGTTSVRTLTLGHGFRSTNGSNFAETSGGVGIGTASPGQKLDVQGGNINTSGDLMTSGAVRISSVGYGTLSGLTTGNLTVGLTATQQITASAGAGSHGIEIGRTDGTASTPYIDFHSGATAVDYDARLVVSGGTGSNAGGALTLTAASTNLSGTLQIGGTTVITAARVLQNVAGITTSGVITSTVVTGTAPLVVASTTVVTNLNADLLDGLDSSAFCQGSCLAGGASGGDLTGTYPNPTIAKLQGSTLTLNTPVSGNILQFNGTAWVNQSVSGDISITGAGVAAITAGSIVNADLATGGFTNITAVGTLTGLVVNGSILPSGHLSGSQNLGGTSNYWGTTYTNDLEVYNNGGVAISTVGSDVNIGAGKLFVQNTTSRVGIGTTAPATVLDVAGAISTRQNNVRTYNNVYSWGTSTPSATGTLEIILPNAWNSTMLRFTINGYDYSAKSAWSATISGYNYSGTPNWYNTSAEIGGGTAPFSNIRLAYDTVAGKTVLLLGTTTDVWAYPQFTITEVVAGFGNQDTWGSGYNSAFLTSEANITNINSPTVQQVAFETVYLQGGNSFGANAILGTNDNFALTFETNNVNRLSVDTSGNVNLLTGGLQVGGTTVITSGRVLQSVVYNGGTIAVGYGGTGQTSFTQYGVLFGNNTAGVGVTAAGTTGQCLVATTGGAPAWGTCAGAGSGVTLQAAYSNSLGGTTPEIVLDSSRTTLDVQAYSGQTADLLDLRAYAASGLGVLRFGVGYDGSVTASGALTVQSGGASITGGINNNNGNITNTGSLTGVTGITTNGGYTQSGSSTNTFTGAISSTNTITGTVLNGTTGINTGAGAGTQRIDASGNLANIGNISGSGTLQLSGTSGSSYIMSALGLGTTTPQAGAAVTIGNSSWISGVDSAGTGYINMFQVNSNNEIQVGAALNIDGGIILPTDGGQMTFSDLPISSSAAAGTPQSYTLRVGSSNVLTVYGEADGSGNAQNLRVAIGSSIAPTHTLEVGGDANFTGDLYGNGKQFLRTNDNFLRINQSSTFTSGIWLGNSPLRAAAGGVYLGSNGGDGQIALIPTTTDQTRRITLSGGNGNVSAISFTQNGNTVCDSSSNCSNYAPASGSANYIQNGTSPQTANFNITGNGVIGGTLNVSGDITTTGKSLIGTILDGSPANLIANGNFETSTAGWTNSANTMARSTAEARFGGASLSLIFAGAGDSYALYSLPTMGKPLDGRSFTFSFWAKASVAGSTTAAPFIQPLSPTGTFCSMGVISVTTSWQRFQTTCTITGNASTTWRVVLRPVNNASSTTYFDGISVQSGTSGTDYTSFAVSDTGDTTLFDGSLGLGVAPTASAGLLQLAVGTTAANGINFGGDVNLYRSAANVLKSDDALQAGNFYVTAGNGLGLGFWGSVPATYGISMSNAAGGLYGDVTDYYLASNMSGGTGRGFIWQYGGVTSAALNANSGNFALKGTLTVNGTGASSIAGTLAVGGALTTTLTPVATFNTSSNKPVLIGTSSNAGVMIGYGGSDIQGRSGANFATNSDLILNQYGGYVGIGTAAPNYSLDIKPAAGNAAFNVQNSAGANLLTLTGSSPALVMSTSGYGIFYGSAISGVRMASTADSAASVALVARGTTSQTGDLIQARDNATNNNVLFSVSAAGNVNTTGTITASSTIQGSQLISTVATGTAPLAVASTTKVANLNVDMIDGYTATQLAENLRANDNITGGGTVSFDGTNVKWTTRFIVISNGRGANFSTNGYFDITMPTSGTITGVGSAANVTATASGIPLGGWQALYYILPIGSTNVSNAANFRIAAYNADLDIPSEWVLIAVRNSESGTVKFSSGVTLASGQSATGGVTTQYIQNGTSPQTADFNITGNGTIGGTLTVTGAVTMSSTLNVVGDISGNSKIAIRTNDTWLRLNPTNAFTAGIYLGTGIVRTDGTLQVGNAGAILNVTNAGSFALNSTNFDINTSGQVTVGTWQASAVGVSYGGTGATTFTANGVLYGNGTAALQATAAGTTGQCLVATTSAAPTWGNCSTTLQGAYTASTGGTTPEIKLDSTRGGLDIQDADTTIAGDLLTVRGSNSSGLGSTLLKVNNGGDLYAAGEIAGASSRDLQTDATAYSTTSSNVTVKTFTTTFSGNREVQQIEWSGRAWRSTAGGSLSLKCNGNTIYTTSLTTSQTVYTAALSKYDIPKNCFGISGNIALDVVLTGGGATASVDTQSYYVTYNPLGEYDNRDLQTDATSYNVSSTGPLVSTTVKTFTTTFSGNREVQQLEWSGRSWATGTGVNTLTVQCNGTVLYTVNLTSSQTVYTVALSKYDIPKNCFGISGNIVLDVVLTSDATIGTTTALIDTELYYVAYVKDYVTILGQSGIEDSGKLRVSIGNSAGYVASVINTSSSTSADGLLIQLGVANASRTTSNYFIGFADGSGTIAGKIQGGASAVAYTTSGADYAEYFRANPDDLPQPGELVSLDATQANSVHRASGSDALVGVISTTPGFIGNGPICDAGDNDCDTNYAKTNVLVSLTGQVPLKTNNEGGTISVGDPIGASSVPGVATRAMSRNIVGYALTTPDTDGIVKVLINPTNFDPSQDLQAVNVVAQSLQTSGSLMVGSNLNVSGRTSLHDLSVSGNASISGNLTVDGSTSVSTLKVGKHLLSQSDAPLVAIGSAAGQDGLVTIDGTDVAGTLNITVKARPADQAHNIQAEVLNAGALANITFVTPYEFAPRIVISPTNQASVGIPVYLVKTNAGWQLMISQAATDGAVYQFDYVIMGSQGQNATTSP